MLIKHYFHSKNDPQILESLATIISDSSWYMIMANFKMRVDFLSVFNSQLYLGILYINTY